jgi:cephalosporin hydroxylase
MTELPPEITVDLSEDLRSYWRDRIRQHTHDVYADVRLSKLPEDLRTYEHLLWADRPDTVIEIGTQYGASALWFRDRLRTLQSYGLIGEPRVVTVDIDQSAARRNLERADPGYGQSIHMIEADVREAGVADQVAALVGKRCLVVEDSAHEYDTTFAALRAFARFVPPDGYFIVEDGSVDIEALRIDDDWPRGVLPALRDWLATDEGREFHLRRDLELYGITSHPSGFLQRRGEAISPRGPGPASEGAPAPDPLELAPAGAKSFLERRVEEQRLSLRARDAEIATLAQRREDPERLREFDQLQRQLVDAEQRLAGIPDLELRIAGLERELADASRAIEAAQDQIRALDDRLTRGQRVLTEVFNSPSWRVTKPLRQAKQILNRN